MRCRNYYENQFSTFPSAMNSVEKEAKLKVKRRSERSSAVTYTLTSIQLISHDIELGIIESVDLKGFKTYFKTFSLRYTP